MYGVFGWIFDVLSGGIKDQKVRKVLQRTRRFVYVCFPVLIAQPI